MRDKYIRVRLSEAEYKRLKEMAEKKETTMSQLIRELVRRAK